MLTFGEKENHIMLRCALTVHTTRLKDVISLLAEMAVAFSANEQVLQKVIEVEVESSIVNIGEAFEVERCVNWIKEKDLKNATLQFPDSLMAYCPDVAFAIESKLGAK